ncbi:MAG: hypothetical protein JOZ05_21925 [Acetobacteraceae bacterium]|nr:hypothetical protein [Acetobacteraceae bacterium]
MLAVFLLAASCAGWHGGAAGHYLGEVQSQGPKAIDTWLEETPFGLTGSYVLHEPEREVQGTLEALGDVDCGVALFRWTDLYGTGIARLRFYPAQHCFDGTWGRETLNPQLTWHSCVQTRMTS